MTTMTTPSGHRITMEHARLLLIAERRKLTAERCALLAQVREAQAKLDQLDDRLRQISEAEHLL